MVVQNNTITDVCQLDQVAAPLWTETFSPTGATPCHADLVVVQNRVDSGPGLAFVLNSVAGAALRENHVRLCQGDAPWTAARSASVAFDASSNMVEGAEDARLCVK